MSDFIKSISYSQDEILKNIIKLYNKNNTFDLDPCYSKGNFYKNIDRPKYCFDIKPEFDYVEKHDCRNLPFNDRSINSIIFDPPFLATTGPSLNKCDNNNHINKRFGVYNNEKELFQFYRDSLKEFDRVLIDGGLIVIKCQDKVSGGTQYISHNAIINYCEHLGFYCEDIFILLAKNRLCANWQIKSQKSSRKFHSYFLVMRKNCKKVNKIKSVFYE